MKTIGILAGMGPRSTTPFLELVLDQCQEQYGAKDDIDFPHIIIYSLPTPFYIDRKINENQLKESIKDGLKRLESFGVSFIAIPCNTAHKYFEELSNDINVTLLNIVEETIKYIKENSKVTLFATESTRESGLYQTKFKSKGIEYIFDDSWQKRLNDIILMIKRKEDIKSVNTKWEELLGLVKEKNINTVIIACTDLNVVVNNSQNDNDLYFIDSSESLARSVVSEYLR